MSRMDLTRAVTEEDHQMGATNAPIQLVEYGDYECPYCAEAHDMVRELRSHFGQDLLYVFRNFPLSEMHPDALRAAEAAEAAGVQGKFWPMQDLLFQNQEELERENLVSYAKKLGLDVHQFQAELKAHTHRARIRRDLQSGNASGVDGTPSFFLNGMAYPGPIDLKSMISDIEEILAQRASGVKKAS